MNAKKNGLLVAALVLCTACLSRQAIVTGGSALALLGLGTIGLLAVRRRHDALPQRAVACPGVLVFPRKTRFAVAAVSFMSWLLMVSSVHAALISGFVLPPVNKHYTDINSNGSGGGPSTTITGNVTYNKTTDLFTADLVTDSFATGLVNGLPTSAELNVLDEDFTSGPWAETKVQINVSNSGTLLSSTGLVPNLSVTGAIDWNNDGIFDDGETFDSPLLTANIVQFGSTTPLVKNNDIFQFYFDVTGGTQALAFGGIGAQIQMKLVESFGSVPVWTSNFASTNGQSLDDLTGMVPEPSSFLLLACGALPLGLLRWRTARRARSAANVH